MLRTGRIQDHKQGKTMKKRILFAGVLLALAVSGCSDEARDDAEELGHDMKRDVQEAGRKIEDAAHDAAD